MAKAEFAQVVPVTPDVVLTLSGEEARWLEDELGGYSGANDPSFDIFHALNDLLNGVHRG